MSGRDTKKSPSRSASTLSATSEFIKSFYNDPFKWSVTKSVAFFAVGVYLARDLSSVNLFEGQ